jgi:hypothetical protein
MGCLIRREASDFNAATTETKRNETGGEKRRETTKGKAFPFHPYTP